jgi:catechol 2,3-dioxygenase-like lactoylglutathione lyase family enzyme
MPASAPRIGAVLETALYVEDITRAARFYEEILGLSPMFRDERLAAFNCGPASVLLLFLRGSTTEALRLAGGEIPPHDGGGSGHAAFAVAAEDLPAWEARLSRATVGVEARMRWPRGGESLYFRDPDANLLELATPGLWANY